MWSSGNAEIPSNVVTTGIWAFSASSKSLFCALEIITPWPAKIIGFLALFIRSTDFSIWFWSTLRYGLYPGRLILESFEKSYSANSSKTSLGISIKTGPGLPVRAIWKASWITDPISEAFITK